MFDWDEDYSDLVGEAPAPADTRVPVPAPAAAPAPSWLRTHLPGVALAALFAAGLAYEKADLGALRGAVGLGPVGLIGAQASGPASAADGPALQVYDPAQAQLFTAGLARIGPDDLRAYAARTRADLRHAVPEMALFHADALTLLQHEMDRRGIAR